jgi:hypothetical protein
VEREGFRRLQLDARRTERGGSAPRMYQRGSANLLLEAGEQRLSSGHSGRIPRAVAAVLA